MRETSNTRMLVKELKALEAEQIIHRQAYATVPPTVEYSLTGKGQSLKSVIVGVQRWALQNQQKPDSKSV